MSLKIVRLPGFLIWFQGLPERSKAQIDARLARLQEQGHFGDAKSLGDGLAELRWKNGWRVYFARLELAGDEAILLVLGGSKSGQEKDIRKARVLLRRSAEDSS